MTERVAVVTGASSGFGKLVTDFLAARGLHVVMVSQSYKKGKRVLIEIARETRQPTIELVTADLAEPEDVKKVADFVYSKFGTVDVLINNAADIQLTQHITSDGLERMMATNHHAYVRLTHHLLPLLHSGHGGRIINITCDSHRKKKFKEALLQPDGWKKHRSMSIYYFTKLLNVLFSKALAEYLEGSGVTVNCLDPGKIHSGLIVKMPALARFSLGFGGKGVKEPVEAAKACLWLALSEESAQSHGVYYQMNKIASPGKVAQEKAFADLVWKHALETSGIEEFGKPV